MVCIALLCVWGVCVMRKLGALVWLCICGLAIAIVHYELAEYIDIECCNRLIACHIFFIQQWQKIIRAPFSPKVLHAVEFHILFLLNFFPPQKSPCKTEVHFEKYEIAHAEFSIQ